MKYVVVLSLFLLTVVCCTDNNLKEEAQIIYNEATSALESKDYALANNLAQGVLKSYEQLNDTLGIIESTYLLARANAFSGDFENAMKYGEKGCNLSRRIGNYSLEYKLNNILSWSYFMLGRSFDETLEHQRRQMFVVEKIDDPDAKALVYNNFGYDATVSGSVPLNEAIEYSKFANDHYAEVEKNDGRWYTLMNLCWQYRLMNDFEKSEEYGRFAVQQAEKDQDRHAIIETNTNLGETLIAQNKIEEARPLYEVGLEWSKQEKDRDKYVFDVYYSRYLWNIAQKELAISSLIESIEFLKEDEVFYEMLARAFLTEFSYELGDEKTAIEQIAVFNNPRASYFSKESLVIARCIEAQILAKEDKEKAIKFLQNELEDVRGAGALFLVDKISKLLDELSKG